jgi:hypothetical protein
MMMVANLFTDIPTQDIALRSVQAMSGQINFNTPANTAVIGEIPPNAVVIAVIAATTTSFNAGTNNNLQVGQSDVFPGGAQNLSAYVIAQPIGPVGTVQAAIGTTGVPVPRAQAIVLNYAQSGTPATQGLATVVVLFVVP